MPNSELKKQLRPYTKRDLNRERRDFFVLCLLYMSCCALIILDIALWVDILACSCLTGLVVRSFCLLHEWCHSCFLGKKSPVLTFIFIQFTRITTISDGPSWKIAHFFHHRHLGKFSAVSPGGIPLLTREKYKKLPRKKQITYHILRHPVFVILLGYFTIFMGISLYNFSKQPKRMATSILPIIFHTGSIGLLSYFFTFKIAALIIILPCVFGAIIGGFLFFVQHIYPEANYQDGGNISSYIDFGKLSNWFSANIGLHHIHHLNAAIPYYKLPVVQQALGEEIKVIKTEINLTLFTTLFTARYWDETKQGFSYY